jgi:hypothetical protein
MPCGERERLLIHLFIFRRILLFTCLRLLRRPWICGALTVSGERLILDYWGSSGITPTVFQVSGLMIRDECDDT